MFFLLDWFRRPSQLDRIETTLQRIEERMSQQEADLNAVLAEQGEKIDNLVADVQRLIAAYEAGKTDLTDEIATVRGQIGRVTGASDAADAAVPPTP